MQANEEKTSVLEKLKAQKAKIEQKEKLIKEKERKMKLRRLIQIGTLAARSEIDHLDDPTLSGAFAQIKEGLKNPEMIKKWRQDGEQLDKVNRLPLIVSFAKEPSEELKKVLRNQNFKWVNFRQEWHGYGIKDEIEKLIEPVGGRVEVVRC